MNQISEILQNARTIAVVGLSGKRFRPSYGVAEYMQRAGYRIIPVNPRETQVLGETSYPDLEAIPEAIDIVDIFRRSEFVPSVPPSRSARSIRLRSSHQHPSHPHPLLQQSVSVSSHKEGRCCFVPSEVS